MGTRGAKALRDVKTRVRKPKVALKATFFWEERQEDSCDVYALRITGMRDDIARITCDHGGGGHWSYFGGCTTSQAWGDLDLPGFGEIEVMMRIDSVVINDRDGIVERMNERESGYKKFTPRKF